MKTEVLNMLRFFLVFTAMLTGIAVGSYAIYYALLHACIYILIFLVGAIGFTFGMFTLYTISEKLK